MSIRSSAVAALASGVLPIFGVLVAGALGYLSGRLLETRRQLTLQKGQAYADYLGALAKAAMDPRAKSALTSATDAKMRICIYGTKAVIRELSAFEQVGARIEGPESRSVVTRLLTAMRRDMGVLGNHVAEADLHSILFGPPRR